MKYMLLIYGNDELWSSFAPEVMADLVAETDAHNRDLMASGEFVGAYGMGDKVTIRQLTQKDGERVVTDGPYLETKEYLGSFTIVDVEDEARALELAAGNPFSRMGTVEVWPLMHEAAPEV